MYLCASDKLENNYQGKTALNWNVLGIKSFLWVENKQKTFWKDEWWDIVASARMEIWRWWNYIERVFDSGEVLKGTTVDKIVHYFYYALFTIQALCKLVIHTKENHGRKEMRS